MDGGEGRSRLKGARESEPTRQFTGELAEPILIPLEPPHFNEDGDLIVKMSGGFLRQLSKMEALAKHYDVSKRRSF